MGATPVTGAEISIGKVWTAFKAGRTYPPAVGQNVGLRGTLGTEITGSYDPSGSLTFGTAITTTSASLGSDFWNLGTPNAYP